MPRLLALQNEVLRVSAVNDAKCEARYNLYVNADRFTRRFALGKATGYANR